MSSPVGMTDTCLAEILAAASALAFLITASYGYELIIHDN